MNEFLYFIKDFFGAPAILIAIFVLLGNILIRRSFKETVIATILGAAGFFALGAGATLMGTTLNAFTQSFGLLVGAEGVLPNSDALAGSILSNAPQVATVASLMMFFGIALNVTLARATRFKYIFLTGHHTLFLAVALSLLFIWAGLDLSADAWYMILAGAIFLAIYMTVTPALSKPFMETITGEQKMYIGHGNSVGLFLGGVSGMLFGKLSKNKFKSAEELKFPGWLNIFSNGTFAVFFTMLVLFSAIYIPVWIVEGKDALATGGIFNSDASIPAKILIDALSFTAGFEVLVMGIKMMVGQLAPALEGISARFIPGAKMGVDVSVGLYFQPTSVLLGFLASFTAGLIGLGVTFGLNSANAELFPAVVIPGIVVHFFCGGVAATFANVKGGWPAALIGGFVNGLIISIVPVVFYAMAIDFNMLDGEVIATQGFHWAESDYLFLAAAAAFVSAAGVVGKWIFLATVIIVAIALVVDGIIHEIKDRKNNPEKYIELKRQAELLKEESKKAKITQEVKEDVVPSEVENQ
ncbi:PTS transporter subunit IIC [Spiroplasma endosymbiont of Othius punctulatus]|uniref:PTS transporter subunit IIC n=1 Tax=Spiroplasma endosymbiont of Othius punctulatus TaxID=3066289 RepID=UPI0030D3F74A